MFLAYIWFIFVWKYLQWNIHIYFHKQLLYEHVKQSWFSGILPIPQKVSHKKQNAYAYTLEEESPHASLTTTKKDKYPA